MTRLLLVDDQALIRNGLRMLVEDADDLEVVGEAGDGEVAVTMAAALRPDVVVMDVRMPRMDGIEATRRILAAGSATRILALTTFDADDLVLSMLEAGAAGYVLKDTAPDQILTAIRDVAEGEAALSPRSARRLIEHLAASPRPEQFPPLAPVTTTQLTARESEVLLLVARAWTNAEIAAHLGVGEATVKTHVSRLLTKLELRDRTHLIVAAYESGLVTPGR